MGSAGVADRKHYQIVPRLDAGFVRKPGLNSRRRGTEEGRGEGGCEAHRASQVVVAVIQNFPDENGRPDAADPTTRNAPAHAVGLLGLLTFPDDGQPAHANGIQLLTLRGRFFISGIITSAAAFKH